MSRLATQVDALPVGAGAGAHARASDTRVAIRNALTLGGSLFFTWGIALGMRLLVPRWLGPELLGTLSFADAFTGLFFVALSLGADVYVRKEVTVRPEHASDFFGGALLLRLALSMGLLVAMALVLRLTDRPPEVRALVYVFAVAQFFVQMNATLSALLHARGRVAGMSGLAVATKVLWAVGVIVAIALGLRLWAFGAAYLLSEAVESVALWILARRHLGLVLRVDVPATKAMIVSSLPYYLNVFATTAYGKLDVTWLTFVGSRADVGFYAASSAVAGLTLLATPLIGWVLMPTFARAAARSRAELFQRLRGATELILSVAIPVSLFAILGAELVVRVLFGDAFLPAVLGLRILAATFVVTYVAIVYAITLLMLERAWTLTLISIAGLAVNLTLNVALVRPMMGLIGPGGGGAGAALALLGTEAFVTASMIRLVGTGAIDRATLRTLGKSLAAAALVVGVDLSTRALGPARLVLDAVVYAVAVLLTGAVRTRELVDAVRTAVQRKTASARGSGAVETASR